MNLKSSASEVGQLVTQIIHFSDGSKKTIEHIVTNRIKQGQFTHLPLADGTLVYINDRNVNMIEVFGEEQLVLQS